MEYKLLVPTTFMNLSGKAVLAMAQFYKLPPQAILVAHDEMALEPGVAKLKLGGGHAGHNGLKDIASQIWQRCRIFIACDWALAIRVIKTKSQVMCWARPRRPNSG